MTHFLFIALILAPSGKSPARYIQERIEARVGQDVILTTDLALMETRLKDQMPSAADAEIRKRALDTLIDEHLIRQRLGKLNLEISDRDVDQRVAAIRQANGIQSNEDFRSVLAEQGLSFDSFRTQVRQQLERAQFINLVRRQASRSIDDAELKSFFQSNQEQFKKTPQIDLAECVIPDSTKDAQKIVSFYKETPNKFNECIKKHSHSPSVARNGLLGGIQKGMLRDDIEAQVFSLKVGEVASVKLRGAVQLLKVLSIKDLGPKKFEDVRDQIRDTIETSLLETEVNKALASMRAETFIKIQS